MSSEMQTKVQASPEQNFTPVQTGLLQRKSALCNTPGLVEDSGGDKEKLTLQRSSVDQAGTTTVPPNVHGTLRSPGQPIDPETRDLMEQRFGHDFSRVRVHTDVEAIESARTVGALAYTVGNEMFFGQDQYKPRSGVGRMLIAHELAHTIQQQNRTQDSATGDGALECDADNAVSAAILNRPFTLSSAVAPPIQFMKVTSGAFGKALEAFTKFRKVPDRAIKLLRQSPSFKKLAAVLDKNYVWVDDVFKADPFLTEPPNGRFKKGPFKGKRELQDVTFGKPSFEPFEAPPQLGSIKVRGDVIHIESTDVPGFISEIAHEATHAARFVGATTSPPATIVGEVNARITDEIETRKSEAKILGEIPAKDVQARVAQVGTRVPLEVERDISPALGMTYLEAFFFARRLREAQAKDGITDADAEKIRDKVNKDFQGKTLPKPKLYFKPRTSGLFELSDYGDIWFNRRMVQREWEIFKKNKLTATDFAVEKEKLLQDNAKRFFEGRISYKPLPKTPATP